MLRETLDRIDLRFKYHIYHKMKPPSNLLSSLSPCYKEWVKMLTVAMVSALTRQGRTTTGSWGGTRIHVVFSVSALLSCWCSWYGGSSFAWA